MYIWEDFYECPDLVEMIFEQLFYLFRPVQSASGIYHHDCVIYFNAEVCLRVGWVGHSACDNRFFKGYLKMI